MQAERERERKKYTNSVASGKKENGERESAQEEHEDDERVDVEQIGDAFWCAPQGERADENHEDADAYDRYVNGCTGCEREELLEHAIAVDANDE